MSSLSRTLPRVLRPLSAPSSRSLLHVSARQLDNTPPPVHRAVIIDLDRVPGKFSNEEFNMTPAMKTLWYGMMAVVVGSFAYINLTPHDWAGNLGYTKKDQEEQKKKKAQEEEEH